MFTLQPLLWCKLSHSRNHRISYSHLQQLDAQDVEGILSVASGSAEHESMSLEASQCDQHHLEGFRLTLLLVSGEPGRYRESHNGECCDRVVLNGVMNEGEWTGVQYKMITQPWFHFKHLSWALCQFSQLDVLVPFQKHLNVMFSDQGCRASHSASCPSPCPSELHALYAHSLPCFLLCSAEMSSEIAEHTAMLVGVREGGGAAKQRIPF